MTSTHTAGHTPDAGQHTPCAVPIFSQQFIQTTLRDNTVQRLQSHISPPQAPDTQSNSKQSTVSTAVISGFPALTLIGQPGAIKQIKTSVPQVQSTLKHPLMSAHKLSLRPSLESLTNKQGYLARPKPSKFFRTSHPHLASIYEAVIATNKPNYQQARIPLPHGLHLPAWEKHLQDYADKDLTAMLQFGFPLGFATTTRPHSQPGNHPSTRVHPLGVQDYLDTELGFQAMAGPFSDPPFDKWFHTSPMMVREKKHSNAKRIIVDLSWPPGDSVNSNIPFDSYEGRPAHMSLPTAEDLATAMLTASPTAHLFCIDLSRAYRQLRIDPQEWPLLGLYWDGQYFFDRALAFGGRWHAAACQRVTTALQHIVARQGLQVWPYLDDIVGLSPDLPTATKHFNLLRERIQELGLEEAKSKATAPTQTLTWIGIQFDMKQMTMTLPQHKIANTLSTVLFWLAQPTIDHKQLQKLTGQLAHVCKCCPTGRLFMSRLYDALAKGPVPDPLPLTTAMHKDLIWFAHLLPHFKGIRLIRSQTVHTVLTVDSCLTGAGAATQDMFYTLRYPRHLIQLQLHITTLEMINTLIAIRLWAPTWQHKNVLVFSGRLTSVG